MRTLNIIIDASGHVKTEGFAGYEGEHNALTVTARFEDTLPSADYFRMVFSSTDGETTVASTELTPADSSLSYTLPAAVTSLGSAVLWQLCAYQMEEETVNLLTKTDTVMLSIGQSLDDNVTSADPTLAATVEAAAAQVESFLSDFSLSTSTLSTPSQTPSLSSSKKGSKYTLILKVPEDFVTSVTTTADNYTENDLFGNCFSPSGRTAEVLVFSKTARVVTVSGVVWCNTNGDRGHTGTAAASEVIYLPYLPSSTFHICLHDGQYTEDLICRAVPSSKALTVVSGSPSNNHRYYFTFSYVCEG